MSDHVVRLEVRHKFEDLQYPPETQAKIDEFLEDYEFRAELQEAGLKPRNLLLLYGPPGCGKTSFAHSLANRLGLPLYAPKQLRKPHRGAGEEALGFVLEFARVNRVILLIDEVETHLGTRDDDTQAAAKSDNGVVTTFLTEIENSPPAGVLVACTNRLDLVDPAVRRRFSEFQIPLPGQEVLLAIAQAQLKGRFGLSAAELIEGCRTPHEVTQRCLQAIRREVITAARANREKKAEEAEAERKRAVREKAEKIRQQMLPLTPQSEPQKQEATG